MSGDDDVLDWLRDHLEGGATIRATNPGGPVLVMVEGRMRGGITIDHDNPYTRIVEMRTRIDDWKRVAGELAAALREYVLPTDPSDKRANEALAAFKAMEKGER